MRKIATSFVLVILLCSAALAEINFPALTGRVVDNANLLSAQTKQNLEAQLAEHERTTTNQVVIVTVPSLEGNSIEDYSYQLGRHWAIGQKDKNNGVVMVVAPNERKVWITVGYGLEGVLTDAQSSYITQRAILPHFRNHDIQGGIVEGTNAILSVLGGKEYSPAPADKDKTSQYIPELIIIFIFASIPFTIFVFFIIKMIYIILGKPVPQIISEQLTLYNYDYSNRASSSFSSSGFSSGSSFSGGGGSFGGGGGGGSW